MLKDIADKIGLKYYRVPVPLTCVLETDEFKKVFPPFVRSVGANEKRALQREWIKRESAGTREHHQLSRLALYY
jgi:hypothetical protein